MEITKESKLIVSLEEMVATLNCRGKYTVAKLNSKGDIIQKSKTLDNPKYVRATRTLNMGFSFIEMALNLDEDGKSHKPKPPKRTNYNQWLRTPEGKLSLVWNTSTPEQKIKIHLDSIAFDLNCRIVTFEIL